MAAASAITPCRSRIACPHAPPRASVGGWSPSVQDWFNLVEGWHSFLAMGRMNLGIFDEGLHLSYGFVGSVLVRNLVQIDGLEEGE
jgi:hypothetical protein